MIASLTGVVAARCQGSVVIEVGGFGLSVQVPASALRQLCVGQEATLSTSLVVREDSLTLFGFATPDERATFELLQSVSGVGSRLALAVLGAMSPDQLRVAVANGDERALMAVSGVGRKVAARLVLELADKLGPVAAPVDIREGAGSHDHDGSGHGWRRPVVDALIGLGWTTVEAERAVATVAAEVADSGDKRAVDGQGDSSSQVVGEMLRRALRSIGPS